MKEKLYSIIFEADTPAGKWFDLILIYTIIISVFAVCIESIEAYGLRFSLEFFIIEFICTLFFFVEYILRLYSSKSTKSYFFSFFGIIDLLAILPVFASVFIDGAESLLVIRAIRLLRIFRLLKLSRFVGEAEVLTTALVNAKHKIIVFILSVITIVVFVGALMYIVEGKESGFDSIPKSMYWAIVTMTTVGYGDLVPHTSLGKFIASMLMIMGYGIIAVPTGIVTAEITNVTKSSNKSCSTCDNSLKDTDKFCSSCGNKVN